MHEHSNVTDKRTMETRWRQRDSEGGGRRAENIVHTRGTDRKSVV